MQQDKVEYPAFILFEIKFLKKRTAKNKYSPLNAELNKHRFSALLCILLG